MAAAVAESFRVTPIGHRYAACSAAVAVAVKAAGLNAMPVRQAATDT
jgi:hypothetical protein